MGCYDTVLIPCPTCGVRYAAQSKGGGCVFKTYNLTNIPNNVLSDVNRHAPFTCSNCNTMFKVVLNEVKVIRAVTEVFAQKCSLKGGDVITCNRCFKKHILYLDTSSPFDNEILYYRCGNKVYAAVVDGHCVI